VVKKTADSFSPKNIALLGLLTLAYFLSARLGVRLAFVQPYATPIWLPAGGAVVAFLVFGYRVWPAVFVGSLLGHLTTIGFVSASFLVPAGATIEGLAGAYLVNRFAHGVRAFETAKDVLLFALFTCVCAPSLNALAGFGATYFSGRANLAGSAFLVFTWWLAHGIGVLLVVPFLILVFRASHHRMNLSEIAELSALLLGLFLVCLLVFGPLSATMNKSGVMRAWLCIPFLMWAAFRFCPLEAAGTTLILFGSAIWGTVHGIGTFASPDRTKSLVLLDTFVGVIGTTTLVVAALVVERRRYETELLGMHSVLRASISGKERELAETAHALETEIAGHSQTKRSLRDSRERLQSLTETIGLKEESQEVHTQREGRDQ
jgi:integral membrane sensor domain MASE1